MEELKASAAKTNPIAKTTATHSLREILKRIPAITTRIAIIQ